LNVVFYFPLNHIALLFSADTCPVLTTAAGPGINQAQQADDATIVGLSAGMAGLVLIVIIVVVMVLVLRHM